MALLKQGMTPSKLAQTFGGGLICSMFPVLGFTTVLNLIVGLRFRLNHPLMQALNVVVGPIHIVMIVVYIRLGEFICRASDDPVSVREMMDTLRSASWVDFLDQFGWAVLHAVIAWAITAPILYVLLYFPLKALFQAVANRKKCFLGA